MTAFVDEHRELYGVEPICTMLPIALSNLLRTEGSPSRSVATAKARSA